jgi:hypothetical protein
MRKRHLPREAQADTAAALMSRVEGQEDVLALVTWNAGPIVPDLDAELTLAVAADGAGASKT